MFILAKIIIMKKIFLLTLTSLAFISCSSDNESPVGQTSFVLPATIGNYWVYDIEAAGNPTSKDSLFISMSESRSNIQSVGYP